MGFFQRLAFAQFGKFQRQQVGFHLQQQPAEQRREAGQFGAEPADPTHRFVYFQRLEGGFYLAGSQQQVALQAG